MHGDVSDWLAGTRGRNMRQMFRPSCDDVIDGLDDGRMGNRGVGDDCWLRRGDDVGRRCRGDGLRGDHRWLWLAGWSRGWGGGFVLYGNVRREDGGWRHGNAGLRQRRCWQFGRRRRGWGGEDFVFYILVEVVFTLWKKRKMILGN